MIGAAGGFRYAAGERPRRDAQGAAEPVAAVAPRDERPARPRAPPPADAGPAAPPPLAEGLRPKKSLSQNFLTDPSALDAIVAAAELQPGERVVEIGPGLGVLTRRLLAAGTSVTAVEVDPRLAAWLRRELTGCPGFDLIEADALTLHPRDLGPRRADSRWSPTSRTTSPARCSTPSSEADRPPERIVLLVQLEVAERVAAPPGRMSYLSAFAQNVATAEVVARVPAAAFEPAPEVDSAVLRLRRRQHPIVPVRRGARAVRTASCRPGSAQRRKQLHNVLARELTIRARSSAAAFAACAVDPRAPPQTLSVDEWACLADRARAAARVTPLRLDAPAKLNLSLRVVGRREDGFHVLDCDLVLLDLADRLLAACRAAAGCGSAMSRLRRRSVPAAARTENLAWRGLLAGLGGSPDDWPASRSRSGSRRPPGLGGGSSDAAAGLAPRTALGARRPSMRTTAELADAGRDRGRRAVLRGSGRRPLG